MTEIDLLAAALARNLQVKDKDWKGKKQGGFRPKSKGDKSERMRDNGMLLLWKSEIFTPRRATVKSD